MAEVNFDYVYDTEKNKKWESNELMFAAIENDLAKILSTGHKFLALNYMQIAQQLYRFQRSIFSSKESAMSILDINAILEENEKLRNEIDELKSKRPAGCRKKYTTQERERVVLLRRQGKTYKDIMAEMGMSKNTVTRILNEAGLTNGDKNIDNHG